jgi:hypothetical protein
MHGGDVISDNRLVRGVEVAAKILGDSLAEHCDIHLGGNFSMAAMLAAGDLSESFSLCLLDVCNHLRHCASAEEFTWSVFDDVENQAMVGLVIHSLHRHHYMALVRNGEQFPAQMLLLDSLHPEEVEVVTAHTFKSIIAGEEADGRYAAQSGYTVLQCVRGRLHERFTDAFLATLVHHAGIMV